MRFDGSVLKPRRFSSSITSCRSSGVNTGSKLKTLNEVAMGSAHGFCGVLAPQQWTNRVHLRLAPCRMLLYDRAANRKLWMKQLSVRKDVLHLSGTNFRLTFEPFAISSWRTSGSSAKEGIFIGRECTNSANQWIIPEWAVWKHRQMKIAQLLPALLESFWMNRQMIIYLTLKMTSSYETSGSFSRLTKKKNMSGGNAWRKSYC